MMIGIEVLYKTRQRRLGTHWIHHGKQKFKSISSYNIKLERSFVTASNGVCATRNLNKKLSKKLRVNGEVDSRNS
jgi:hypothetical protein